MSRRLGSLALACLVLMVWPALAWAKLPEGIGMSVQVGNNGWVQLSTVNPVVVDLDNQSKSLNLSGELALVYNGVEYSTKLDLPTPSTKRFYLYFPCDNWAPYITLRIRTKQYTEQFDLSQQYKPMALGDISCIVLSQQSGSLGALNQQPAVRLQRDLYRSRSAQLATGKVFVAYYDLQDIDPTPKFFSRADMVVISDIDYTQVTPQIAEALKAYVTGGGSLVFSIGLNASGLTASPLAPLCPLRISGTTQVGDLGVFGRQYKIPPGSAATFAAGTAVPGATVSASAGGLPAVVRQVNGSGTVTALAFDYTQAPFKFSPLLGRLIADNALQIGSNMSVSNWFLHPALVDELLLQLAEAVPMRPMFVFLFLLTYIALIGPLNFLILSRLKRRTLVWTTIPLIILGFAWFGLETGRFYRGSNNVCAYFQELHVYPGAAYTPYQTVMLVFTAERVNYKLSVPDASAFLYPSIPAVEDTGMFNNPVNNSRGRGVGSGRIDNSSLPTVISDQGKWTSKEFFYQGYMNSGAQVSADLTAVRRSGAIESVTGSYDLQLPFDLYDAYLIGPGRSISDLGYVPGHGAHEMNWRAQQTAPPNGRGLDLSDYLIANIPKLTENQRDSAGLALRYRDELLLVGFTDSVEALAKFNRPHKEHLLTMVVLHLPYKAVIPTTGQLARNIRGILTGGSDVELRQQYGMQPNYDPDAMDQQYMVRTNSFLDIAYEISGDLGDKGGRLLMHVRAYDQLNSYEPTKDLSYLFKLQGWNGTSWVDFDIPENDTALDIPIASIMGPDRKVRLRFKASKDIVLEIPSADVY